MNRGSAIRYEHLFPGDSEMARRMASFDWAQTPLGPVETWPGWLRTMVAVMLGNRHPMAVWWGRECLHLYNDAYRPILGDKHPESLGRSGAEVWRESWNLIGPMARGVFDGGPATWNEDFLFPVNRRGFVEETYFTFSYSPIPADTGAVGGVLVTTRETTVEVQDARQIRTLHDLAAQATRSKTLDDVLLHAARVLADNDADFPFALLYAAGDGGSDVRLVATAGMDRLGAADVPPIEVWPFDQAREAGRLVVVPDLRRRVGRMPSGRWTEAPEKAVVSCLARPGLGRPYGFLVSGASPRRSLDEHYLGFFRLTADAIVAGVANVLAYEEEKRRAEALAEIDRAKTVFFANVSHEFRTPLTLIRGPVEDALRGDDEALGPRTTERLEMAHRNSTRLLKLVNTLLDFSRIEAGRMQALYEETDLCAFTEDLASVFRSAFERAGLSLEVSCERIRAPVFVDREMWERIVFNVLSNAFKFTLRGGATVSVRERGGEVVLSIRDTGSGIPPDELPHVFERFHRIRGTEGRTDEGTGIGLALVHELVKLHGGTVGVESELGRGTCFTVAIPTGAAHLPADRLRPTRTPVSSASAASPYVEEALSWLPDHDAQPVGEAAADGPRVFVPTAGARVLVADDNADMRRYLARVLAAHWDVDTARDGKEALEKIRQAPPDLVLADVMMPRRDGIALVQAIRQDATLRLLPVLLFSARVDEEARVEGLGAGADDYLTKPFSVRELVARVNGHLQLARSRHQVQMLMARQNEALGLAVGGAPLDDVLRVLAGAAEAHLGDGTRARLDVVTDTRPPPDSGRPADREAGFAWSLPIRSARGGVLGSLAVQHPTKREPHPRDLDALQLLAQTAALVIEGYRATVERDRAEGEARRRGAQFMTLLNQAPLGVYLVDADLRIREANPVARAAAGDVPEVVGLEFVAVMRRLWDADHVDELVRIFRHTLATGEPYAITEQVRRRLDRGVTEYYEWQVHRTPLPEGGFGVVCYFRDISALMMARDERETLLTIAERARAEAESANRAKDEFLAVLSHELRSPLNAMLGWIRILKHAGSAEPLVRRAVETLERNIWAQAQVINDLLDVSRIISGKLELERSRVDLAAVVAGAVDSLQPLAVGKRITLELTLGGERLEVDGDSARLQQIVGNLLHNAIKFTSEGGRIAVRAYEADGRVVVRVEDTGVGIEPALLPHVFDRFVQSESSTTRRHGGLGLGLSIVRQLTALHGGTVEAASAGIGRGATFTVHLPLASPLATRIDPIPPAGLTERVDLACLDVLLVEDDVDSREAMSLALQASGMHVRMAGSMRQALDEYDARPPDVLVSDIGMPGEDGYSLIRAIREREQGGRRRTLAIAITGFATRRDQEVALRAGFDEHVGKPVLPDELLARVRVLKESRGGRL